MYTHVVFFNYKLTENRCNESAGARRDHLLIRFDAKSWIVEIDIRQIEPGSTHRWL